jgi:peptidoglycan/xylan/chitin deacetylase (PgdA/CDA1 family)
MTQGFDWICLMYHDVADEAPGVSGGKNYFSVSQSAFSRQLAMIASMGWRGRSIAEVIGGGSERAVAISFDDGDLGQATRAFPTLVAHGMTATFFVTTDWVGRKGYASWDQLREMRDAGMSIQSHTHTHPFLSELDEAEVRDELRRSRDLIDHHLGQRTTMLALPGGDAPRSGARRLLVEEGYAIVATSRWGTNGPKADGSPLYVRRCTIRGEPEASVFRAVAAGDRWLSMKKRSREGVLAFIRSSLGPTRYARWRRGILDAAGPRKAHKSDTD